MAFAGITAHADGNRVIIDGAEVSTPAQGGLLPLWDVVDSIGGSISWSGHGRHVIIRQGDQTIIITVRCRQAIVNGRRVTLAAPITIIGERVMVTRCFIVDYLGVGVGFINNSFIISSTPATHVPVLIYHHILPDEVNTHFYDNAWTISTENFAEQMRYLRDNSFYTPTLHELEAFLYHGRPLPQNSVMIHFDDGYYSNFVYAYPILERYGLRAVLFPITGNSEVLGDVQPPMDYSSLTHTAAITLRRASIVFETASHSHALHDRAEDGRTLLVASTKEEIIADTRLSFEFVTNRRAYAYPLGMFNETVIEALQEAGISMAFTVNRGYVTADTDPFRLPRFTIYQTTRMERFRDIVNREM